MLLSALSLLGLALLGCGRPATEEECLSILRKSARVELTARLAEDEKLIADELAEIEKAMKPTMMKECVGKRVSDETLRCVERAKSKDELFGGKGCFH